jgi:hypothetical protein
MRKRELPVLPSSKRCSSLSEHKTQQEERQRERERKAKELRIISRGT